MASCLPRICPALLGRAMLVAVWALVGIRRLHAEVSGRTSRRAFLQHDRQTPSREITMSEAFLNKHEFIDLRETGECFSQHCRRHGKWLPHGIIRRQKYKIFYVRQKWVSDLRRWRTSHCHGNNRTAKNKQPKTHFSVWRLMSVDYVTHLCPICFWVIGAL